MRQWLGIRQLKTVVVLSLALALLATTASCRRAGPPGQTQPQEQTPVAPDFTLPDLSGNDVTLSSLRGKPVLLSFWSTT